ncbi:MAG: FG-GAP-like repeat-containing protein, partial [Gammaproteobacteria bacterium]
MWHSIIRPIAGLLVLSVPVSAQAAVGRTPTTFDVSPSGEASYSIPIFAPSGTHGMTPALSLTYSSRGGSGWIGEGWAIGGYSVISRCVQTWAQDGAPRNVRLDYSDRYCLDGNRLRLVSGSHGGDGAEYRTEIETFARVKSVGAAGNGPASFEVELKNGLKYVYGATEDSRIQSLGVLSVRSWAVNRISDRAGNAILFSYTEDATNGSYRIANVRYTENLAQGLSAAYMVEFVYETQPPGEIDSGYLGGSLIRDVTRLTRVDVTHNAGLVRRYNVTYEPGLSNTGKSRVQSIQECAGSGGTDCLPATTFAYQNGTIGVGNQVSSGVSVAASWMPLDVNGDGRSDVVYSSSATCGSGVWMVMFANSSGGFNAPVNSGITSTNCGQAIPIDYNADGLEDFLVPYSGGTWWVVQGTTSGLSGPVNTGVAATGAGGNARAMDINGDGLDDLVFAIVTGTTHSVQAQLRVWGGTFGAPGYLYGPLSAPFTIIGPVFAVSQFASKTRSPDFNGDGLSDFVVHVREADGEPGVFFHNWYAVLAGGAGTVWLGNFNTAGGPYWPDLNGDGCSDAVYTYNNFWRYRFSGCLGLGAEQTGPIMSSAILQTQAAVFDWDNDGYDDIVGRSTTTFTWHYMRSTGESLSAPVDSVVSASPASAPFSGDANGDGLDDLVYPASSNVWAYTPHAGVKPDLLQTATDGYGNVVTFNYAALPNANYTKYADAVFPEQDYQGALYVVNSLSASNGLGGSFTRSFHYYGARLHRQGRGLEGFYARYEHDSRNGVYAYQYFNRAFPYTGTDFQRDSHQPGGTTIQLATNSWTAHSYGAGFETRYLPFVQSSAVHSYEVGGMFNGALVRSISVSSSVDAATGTLYDSTTTMSEPVSANGVQSGASYVARTHHPLANLFNDYVNWCFGRPGVTQQINSHNLYGGGAQTRQVNTSWNGAFCRPTQHQVQPGDPQWHVTVDLGYDGYGNLNNQTVTGIAMPARTTSSVWAAPGSFPTSISRPVSAIFSETTQMGWNYALGVQASETDPNGIATSWQHDTFGRRTLETRADGTDTVTTYNDCASFGCQGPNNKLLVIEQMRDTADSVINDQSTYFDKFDRAFVTTTRQLSGSYDRNEIAFDALGRISQRNAPCWWASCTYYWTTYQYDLLNRPTQESRPVSDSDPTIQTSSMYYEGATTRTVDAQGKQKTIVVSALGAPARSTDHAGYYQSFDYDPFGNSIRVTDSSGNTLQSATYNIRGARLTLSDLDAGNWTYLPNALGELASQTDANAKTTSFTWDFQSRPLTRVFPEGGGSITSTWSWGQSAAARNIGQLASTQISGTGLTTYGEALTFDSLGRFAQTQVTEGSNAYNVEVGYSPTTGFLDTLTYPTSTAGYRLKLQYEYQSGQLLRVKDFNAPTTVYWQGNATDARGLITDETLGNGLRTTKSFDLITGSIDYIRTGPGGGTSVQTLSYLFDKVGTLPQRQDGNQSLTENFFYDDLYRLDYSTLNSLTNLNVDYDALGNITFKSDVGSYTYHAT